jgi:hypothetical protein
MSARNSPPSEAFHGRCLTCRTAAKASPALGKRRKAAQLVERHPSLAHVDDASEVRAQSLQRRLVSCVGARHLGRVP